jgi:probable phosphoglycerate mutase
LLFVRHGLTDWNESRRLQGHKDIDLSVSGCAQLANLRLPGEWSNATWYASPLLRAMHSAQLLGAETIHDDLRLKEMSWGDWEGRTLASLRSELGDRMRDNEARGLDFRPDGGESPRDVCVRLRQWFFSVPTGDSRSVVVTHKGVIRAALSVATGWPMLEAFNSRPDWNCGHEFALDDDSRLSLTRLNVPLDERTPL